MDLDEYLFYEKKKDRKFTAIELAKKLGITKSYLNRIRQGLFVPSPKLCYRIHKETHGMVDAWLIIKNFYEKEERK